MKGVVNITASSNSDECHRVTDYGWNWYWHTNNEPNSWLCFDFKEKTVSLTKYSLKSGEDRHLVRWVMEGSNDGSSWEELDRRDTEELSEPWITKTYDCERLQGRSFRYLRLCQTGNSNSDDCLSLSHIEFFGTIGTDEKAAAVRRKLIMEEEDRRRHGMFLPCDDRPF